MNLIEILEKEHARKRALKIEARMVALLSWAILLVICAALLAIACGCLWYGISRLADLWVKLG